MLINTTHTADGNVVVHLRGEVDLGSADRLRQTLKEAAESRPKLVVVDLLHVTFIDSTGLGALISGRYAAQIHNVAYKVRDPNPFVATQLRKTGLYDILVTGI